ncbi:MAG: hypothetical protein KJ063_22245 [Anaerolineae bacterium]|nr:hypothetical protein [Anaerolineae bacterium]
MNSDHQSKTDQILDLLLDALAERQQSRQPAGSSAAAPPAPPSTPPPITEPPPASERSSQGKERWEAEIASYKAAATADTNNDIGLVSAPPEPLPSIQLDQMLGRLAVIVGIFIILINIPFNRAGLSLARAMPDAQSLIIRDGLVLKGSGDQIYVLEKNQKRWITTLDAFAWHGYRWEQVNIVNDTFLNQFPDGPPVYVLLKCTTSPHIYALENGQKRWVKDIATFEAEGFVWEDVKFISCQELRRLPTGTPIPPDAGLSPEP